MTRFLYGKPLILAHRCVYPNYPENTILSLKKVIDEGADYVEIDCEFTKDFHLIVSHDSEVDRCTDAHGKIENLTFNEIRTFNAAHYLHNPQFAKEPIPTVEEIFQTIASTNIRAELHIKNLNVLDYESYSENIPDLLVKYGLETRCNINIDILTPAEFIYEKPKYARCRFSQNAYIDENYSDARRMEKLLEILNALRNAKFIGLDLRPSIITREVSNKVHDYSMELQCYPTNDPIEMQRLIVAECDVIQTDRMDLLKTVRQKAGF